MSEVFDVGDVVRVHGLPNAPAMVVQRAHYYVDVTWVDVTWFDQQSRRQDGGYEARLLERVDTTPAVDIKSEENEQCPCGHSKIIEHNESGCYHGCSAEQCAPSPER